MMPINEESDSRARVNDLNVPAPQRGRVFLVEECPIIRKAVVSLINAQEDLEICGAAEDEASALPKLASLAPDLILLGTPPRSRGGLESLKAIKGALPDQLVLIFAIDDEALFASRALRQGAAGYVMKREPIEKLLTAIRRVLAGDTYVSGQLRSRDRKRRAGPLPVSAVHPLETLNERELEVFQLIGSGKTRSQIAESLHLTPKAVDHIRSQVKSKLCLSSASELIRHAVEMKHEAELAPAVSA